MPVQPQGSRTGLITALVIFVILFVTTTILFIFENANARKAEMEREDLAKRMSEVATESELGETSVTELTALRSDSTSPYGNMTALSAAIKQRNDLASQAAGSAAGNVNAALEAVRAAQARASEAMKAAGQTLPPSTNLAAAVQALANQVTQLNQQNTTMNQQLQAANEERDKTIAAQEAMLKERDDKIAELSTAHQTAMDELKQYQTTSGTRIAATEKSAQEAISSAQSTATKLQGQVSTLQTEVKDLQRTKDQLEGRLSGLRVNPNEAIVQSPDGRIIRVPGDDVVYVDLGTGDRVAPGMTFEVYDRNTGIPALGDGLREGEMPIGKASIEIIRPGPGGSEARLVRKTLGEEVVEGDLISNLIYDPRTTYNFVVYGEFDLNQDGKASTADGEVVKRLVTQWGGRVVNDVNVDSDFVVMGKEPVVPNLSEEDAQDPVLVKEREDAEERLTAYNRVRDRAIDLHVPIMNQNRFLYFVGFYSQSAR